MESLFYSFVTYTIIALLGAALGIYLYFRERYKFWKKLNIPYIPASFPWGNIPNVGSEKLESEFYKRFYDMSPGKSIIGIHMISRPLLIVRDPELLQAILIKEFKTFHDRGIFQNEKDDPLRANLFGISGVKWRNLRVKLSPTFTSAKIKMMFPILLECSEELKEVLKEPARRGEIVEMKDIAARFTTDIISSCAFGIQTNSIKNPDAIFRVMGKKIFAISSWGKVKRIFLSSCPELGRRLGMAFTTTELTEFFFAAVKDTMEYREKNNIERKDFLQMLIQLKNQGRLKDVDDVQYEEMQQDDKSRRFTYMDAAAQAFVFFNGGFENTSTTIQFALYELAMNPDIQDRLREEIRDAIAKDNGKLTYEGIHNMQFLGQIIDETLRKYPTSTSLQRECNKDFRIPNSNWVIPKGTPIRVPILGIHHDPQYYPHPEKFDPDRFTEEEKASRRNYVYLPFGDGPRTCIGMRFALMVVRVGLVSLVANFRIEVSVKTTIPPKLNKNAVVLLPRGGMHLKIKSLK